MAENVPLAVDHRVKKQVESLTTSGYAVTIITPFHPENQTFAREHVRVYEYRPLREPRGKLGFLWEYATALIKTSLLAGTAWFETGFDAVQACQPPDTYFLVALPLKWLGKPYVMDQRDPSPELYVARYGQRGKLWLTALRMFERLSYRSADRVICVNETLRRQAETRGGVDSGSVTVVGNGPWLRATQTRPRLRLKHGRAHLVCWLGVMGAQDNVSAALDVISVLVHEHGRRDCHFAFLGDGESRGDLMKKAHVLGLDDFVTFTGWLDDKEMYEYVATADIGLEPNLQDIVTPVKGMLYMGFGVPFVAFDVAETRAMAESAALYVEPGDVMGFAESLERLLREPELRAQMGRSGKARVERQLAWDVQQQNYLTLYRELIGSPPVSRETSNVPILATGRS